MLPTEELFVYVYAPVHGLIVSGAVRIPRRPGPAPACTDAELLAIAEVRHLLGRRSESAFLAEVARDRGHLFPRLPHQGEATAAPAGSGARSNSSGPSRLPEDDCRQAGASALPARHPSRVQGADQ
jgi:hypothetical protein